VLWKGDLAGVGNVFQINLFKTLNMKAAIFWDTAPCSPYIDRRFGGNYNLHLQGRKSAEQDPNAQQVAK
jgi:hypothetical protein